MRWKLGWNGKGFRSHYSTRLDWMRLSWPRIGRMRASGIQLVRISVSRIKQVRMSKSWVQLGRTRLARMRSNRKGHGPSSNKKVSAVPAMRWLRPRLWF